MEEEVGGKSELHGQSMAGERDVCRELVVGEDGRLGLILGTVGSH